MTIRFKFLKIIFTLLISASAWGMTCDDVYRQALGADPLPVPSYDDLYLSWSHLPQKYTPGEMANFLANLERRVGGLSDAKLIENINKELEYYMSVTRKTSLHHMPDLPGIELHGKKATVKLLVSDLQDFKGTSLGFKTKDAYSQRIWENFVGNVLQGEADNYYAIFDAVKDKQLPEVHMRPDTGRHLTTYYLHKEFAKRLNENPQKMFLELGLTDMQMKLLRENLDKILKLFP